jgi:hypothetical protein
MRKVLHALDVAERFALAIEPVRQMRGYSNRDIGCRSLTIRKK